MAKPFSMTEQEYQRLGVKIRAEIMKAYRHDSCIATARTTLDVLRKLGVDAYELPVQAAAFNKEVLDWTTEHGRFPVVGSEDYPDGGYAIGVGVGPENPADGVGWNGHLVVIAERKWMLDFSIDQMSRPAYGIIIDRPLVLPVTEKFLRSNGREPLTVFINDALIQYSTAPGKRLYKISPNWAGETAPSVTVTVR